MRVIVVGAGQVGSTVVEALHEEHDVVVVDLDPHRLSAFSYRYDVVTLEGTGASRRTLRDAGKPRGSPSRDRIRGPSNRNCSAIGRSVVLGLPRSMAAGA